MPRKPNSVARRLLQEKAVSSQPFNNLAGLLGDEFMKRGATLHGW